MPNYTDHAAVLQLLSNAQEAEQDNRERVREVINFLEKDDGQWEPAIVSKMSGRPRYTFDKCNPVVDSIAGELEQAEFGIKVRPAGGDATQDLAKLYDGIIRNIQSMSGAENIFSDAGRSMIACGFDAWRVTHDWVDGDSFEQDLLIKKIANAVDRVWFDEGAELQSMADARHAFVLQAIPKEEYNERFPDGSGESISDARTNEVYSYKGDFVVIGEILYKSKIEKELVLMSNNAVYEVDDDFKKVVDELKADGITEIRRRKRDGFIVKTRLFDGKYWLNDEKETVFNYIPIIPTYANFKISENKVIYRGAVNKLMDAQRVYNYAQSRSVEEGALAPRGKYWITRDQAVSDMATLQTMNTNANPVQTYTHVEGQPQPFWQGGAQINQGLQQISSDMASNIVEASGVFAANQGNAPRQSGYAIELQQGKGDNSSFKYFKSQEIAIEHTARVLINAIPKVYDTKRVVRILGEDGTSAMETINDDVYDADSKQMVSINDLRKGKYDVVCDVGPAFKNRQQETARAFLEAAGIDPTLLEFAKDIWLKNLNAPGFDQIAERARKQLLDAGAIPDAQMTDEEKERVQDMIEQKKAELAQQGPDPMQQAILEQTQANTADVMSKAKERDAKAMIEAEKLRQAEEKMMLDAQLKSEKSDQDFQMMMFNQQMEIIKALKTQAETMKVIKEAIGANAIIGPGGIEAYANQAELVSESQEAVGGEDIHRMEGND